jgi:hypothetical protein
MYKLQPSPDPKFWQGNREIAPVATLKDQYGGVSHIVEDDHCYVLYNGGNGYPGRPFAPVIHWYPEAVEAMKSLPTPVYP